MRTLQTVGWGEDESRGGGLLAEQVAAGHYNPNISILSLFSLRIFIARGREWETNLNL